MAAHRYWRINMTLVSSNAFAFSEIQFRTTAGVSLGFSGGTASAADTYLGAPGPYDASHAADGNTSTLWSGTGTTLPQWWAYDFGTTSGNWRDVVQIAITSRADSQPEQAPLVFTPQWSDDGSAWTSMLSITAAAWVSLAQTQLFTVTPDLPASTVYTSWNPSDKAANIIISNVYRTAKNIGGTTNSVRATTGQATGKFYWEYTIDANIGGWVGIAISSVSLTAGLGLSGPSGTATTQSTNGDIYIDGAAAGSLGAGFFSGAVCVAFDATAKRIWFRAGAAGNWNGSSLNNPATGVGGFSTPNLGGAAPAYPIAGIGSVNGQVTANFGDTAFVGAVPAGFTAGWNIAAGGGGSGSTLVWTDNFDSYTAGINVPAPWVVTTVNPASTAQAHSNPNSLAVGTGGSTSKCYRPFGANLSQWYADFWMWTNSVGGTTNQVVSFQSTTAGPAVYVNAGASGAGQVGMTGFATWFTFTVTTVAWHHYLFEVTQALAGTAKLTVDGTVVGTYSGDTRDQSSGPNAYSAYVACIGVTIGPSPPAEFYVDDLSIYSGVVTAGGGAAQARAMVLA